MLTIENLYYNNSAIGINFKIPYAKFNSSSAVLIDSSEELADTFIDIILGRKQVSGLSVKIDNDEIDLLNQQFKIGELTSNNFLYPELTLKENIYYYCKLLNFKKLEINNKINWLLQYFDIFPSLDKKSASCTVEEQFIIHLFLTIVKFPKILILSSLLEITSKNYPKEKLMLLLQDLQANGMVILYKNSVKSYFKEHISELKILPIA